MRWVRLAAMPLLALLALSEPAAGAAQGGDIVVKGGVARLEIERILEADNVDTSRLSTGEVVEALGAIQRGRAPDDFWLAYRAHVRAWERLADAEEAARRSPSATAAAQLEKAEGAIDSTFDEVERIARLYGARLPVPPWAIPPTV